MNRSLWCQCGIVWPSAHRLTLGTGWFCVGQQREDTGEVGAWDRQAPTRAISVGSFISFSPSALPELRAEGQGSNQGLALSGVPLVGRFARRAWSLVLLSENICKEMPPGFCWKPSDTPSLFPWERREAGPGTELTVHRPACQQV